MNGTTGQLEAALATLKTLDAGNGTWRDVIRELTIELASRKCASSFRRVDGLEV